MKTVIRLLLILLGGLLVADTLLVLTRSNGHLGVWLPAVFGLPLLLIGIFFSPLSLWFSAGFGAFVKWALIVCYALALVFFISVSCLINSAPEKQPREADAVIVLGGGLRGSRVSLSLAHRLDTAADYLEAFPNAVAVVSGSQGAGEDVTEASAMRKYLLARGIDDSRIIMEERATSTLENFKYSYPLVLERCGNDADIAFVTTRFHVFRSQRVAKSLGIDTLGIAAPGVWYITFNDYLRECVAVTVYWLTGRL